MEALQHPFFQVYIESFACRNHYYNFALFLFCYLYATYFDRVAIMFLHRFAASQLSQGLLHRDCLLISLYKRKTCRSLMYLELQLELKVICNRNTRGVTMEICHIISHQVCLFLNQTTCMDACDMWILDDYSNVYFALLSETEII